MCVASASRTKCGVSVYSVCLDTSILTLSLEFLNVSQLTPVSFQKNAWDRLVLDGEYKDVLETIVSSHIDKVAGLKGSASGKGLSILLHGETGVGKTLTAGTYFKTL